MTDLVSAWQSADSVERGVWVDRLMKFNELSNSIKENIRRREKLAAELGVTYDEVLRRENEEISRRNLERLVADKRSRRRE